MTSENGRCDHIMDDDGDAPTAGVQGAQSIRRALALLKLVMLRHETGITGPELAAQTGLNRVTVARLLAALAAAGLVRQDGHRRYALGIGAVQIGLAAMRSNPIIDRCRPMMIRLARETEDTVFLLVRNGDYGQCIHHEEGSYPVKALVLRPGDLRLLGVGSAGLALIASLPDREIHAIHARNRSAYPASLAQVQSLLYLVGQARQQGFSTSSSLVADGVSGVGLCFEIAPDYRGAVSVAAIDGRMTRARQHRIAGSIHDELRGEGFTLVEPRRPSGPAA